MTRLALLFALPLILAIVACDEVESETDPKLPTVVTTAVGPNVSAISGNSTPNGAVATPENLDVLVLSNSLTPIESVAPSEPVSPRQPIACSPEIQPLLPNVKADDAWGLSGLVISEGTTPDKRPYLNGTANSGSITFSVTESGIWQEWVFRDQQGAELDRYGAHVEWVPQVVTDGNPALTLDWECHKDAWLTGGIPSFSYYTRDYAVGEQTLESGLEVVQFKIDTTFYSSDEDLVRHKDYVYGYDKSNGRIAAMGKHEYGTLDGVPFSLNQQFELDVDLDISEPQIPVSTEVPTSTPTPVPLAAVLITPTFATSAPGSPLAEVSMSGNSTSDDCQKYLTLQVSSGDDPWEAVVTSYRCYSLFVDSTGRPSSHTPTLTLTDNSPVGMVFFVDAPVTLEARVYSGEGISGSFMRWPEDLTSAYQAVTIFEIEPDTEFEIDLPLASGNYSLVVKATWEGPIEVFYALGLAVE